MKLNETTPEWERKFNKLLTDPFLKKKYNRKRRIQEKKDYINENCSSLKKGGKFILDIGPGPGEFLELCRKYGNKVSGIDAPPDDCEMGANYLKLSKLMTERQRLSVEYSGFNCKTGFYSESVDFINSQGAIEQCFYDLLEGPPHRDTHMAGLLSWKKGPEMHKRFLEMWTEFNRILTPGGNVLIYGNGTANTDLYDKVVQKTAKDCGFELVWRKSNRFHKWVK